MSNPISPKHYSGHWLFPGQCVDYVRHCPFPQGNAIKYLWRFEDKGTPKQDVLKALKYLEWTEPNRSIPAGKLDLLESAFYSQGKKGTFLQEYIAWGIVLVAHGNVDGAKATLKGGALLMKEDETN